MISLKINRNKFQGINIPILYIFLISFIIGILIMNLGKSTWLVNTGLLDEYTLYHMKYITVDSNALFLYVLKERLLSFAVLIIFSTTYMGIIVVWGYTIWYGISAGMLLSAVVIRYGIRGMLLIGGGLFPHYLLYIPIIYIMLILCENTCRRIYFRHGYEFNDARKKLTTIIMQYGILLISLLLGCALESYVNPIIFTSILKIF